MKRIRLCLLALLLGQNSYSQLNTGYEELIQGKLFCIHSQMLVGTSLFNTSSIYLIKGTNDSVHVFGCGYGKPEDIRAYRDCVLINTSFNYDVHLADSIIRSFGFDNPKIMFWVMHGHCDHINASFIYAMDSIFNTMQSKIYVHVREHTQVVCNEYCGGFGPCVQGDVFFGCPYTPKWGAPVLNQFVKIGKKTDACDVVLKHITTSYGTWQVLKAGTQHTPGGLNLFYPGSGGLKILGSEQSSGCNMAWAEVFPCHGNCDPDMLYNFP